MTRTATTKFVATALAVASLGFAATAQADDGQGFATGEPTPGQPVPAQTQNQGTQDQAPAQNQDQATQDQAPVEKSQDQLDKQRFERYCNMKDAEPSHSDKAFCDQYRKTHPTTTTTTTSSNTGTTTNHQEPSYEKHYEKPGYEQPSYHKASEPSKGSLPFTGLEIWQLGLIGIVLVGGGIGARRLLVS